MRLQPTRRSSLFLLELIISILFFSLSSAVCVRIFVKSSRIEAESVALSHAVTAASSAAEVFRSQEDVAQSFAKCFPKGEAETNGYQVYYDKDWNFCPKEEAESVLFLTWKVEDSFRVGQIEVKEQEEILYQLEVKTYQEGR